MEQKQTFSQAQIEKKFKEGISLMLSSWPCLKLAIQNGWVSQNAYKLKNAEEGKNTKKQEKWNKSESELCQDFIDEVFSYVLKYQIDERDVQDFLLDYMEDFFFIVVEDNSEKIIAKAILDLYAQLQEGKEDKLIQIREFSQKLEKIEIKATNNNQEEDDSESDYEDCEEEDEDNNKQQQKSEDHKLEEEQIPNLQPIDQSKANQQKEEEISDQNKQKQKPEPIIDEDGFIMVQSKSKKKGNK